MNVRSALAVAALATAFLACGGREPRFDMQHPPAWLQRLDRIGSNVRAEEISGNCFQPFTGQCTAQVQASRALLRKAVLRLAAGDEAQLTYTPADGTPISMTVDRKSDARVRVKKSGGTLTIACTAPQPALGCQFVLVSEER